MRKSTILGLLTALCFVSSCSNDEKTPKEEYDGFILTTVLKSECLGDVYGQNVNIINLLLSTGEIHSNESNGFEGEGTCLVLALFDKMSEDLLPSEGSYNGADWNTMNLVQTFDPGFCEYQQEYSEWLTNGTYMVSIDKNGQQTYTALTGGNLTISSGDDGYTIEIALKDEEGNLVKARYVGNINFEVQKPVEDGKYKYEDSTPETLAPVVNSVDYYFMEKDYATGFMYYKISIWAAEQVVAQMMLYMPESANGMIPDGKYSISEEITAKYILAGYFENEEFAGSYFAKWDESFSHLMKVWYLTSGELSIKSNDATTELTISANSAYGSSITINYKGEYSFTDATISAGS